MEDLWRTSTRVKDGTKSRPRPKLFARVGPYAPLIQEYVTRAGLRTVRRGHRHEPGTWPVDITDFALPDEPHLPTENPKAWLLEQVLMADIARLPPKQAAVANLRWTHMRAHQRFMPSDEVASLLNMTRNAVDTNYSRAKKHLLARGIDLDRAESICREWQLQARRYKPPSPSEAELREEQPPIGGQA